MVDAKRANEEEDITDQITESVEQETEEEHHTLPPGMKAPTAGMAPAANGGGSGSPSATVGAKEESNAQQGTQAAGEAATEAGRQSGRHQEAAKNIDAEQQQQQQQQQLLLDDRKNSFHPRHSEKRDKRARAAAAAMIDRDAPNRRSLPDSLELEVGNRAFPSSQEGIACLAFHALAAEAVWAGLNGSGRVEKPPESVWDPRGGDRWATAAFFAETLGERGEDVGPGLPQMEVFQVNKEGGSGGCGSGHPLSGSSARHAAARVMYLAAVSSRRGFLQQATDTAAKEVW